MCRPPAVEAGHAGDLDRRVGDVDRPHVGAEHRLAAAAAGDGAGDRAVLVANEVRIQLGQRGDVVGFERASLGAGDRERVHGRHLALELGVSAPSLSTAKPTVECARPSVCPSSCTSVERRSKSARDPLIIRYMSSITEWPTSTMVVALAEAVDRGGVEQERAQRVAGLVEDHLVLAVAGQVAPGCLEVGVGEVDRVAGPVDRLGERAPRVLGGGDVVPRRGRLPRSRPRRRSARCRSSAGAAAAATARAAALRHRTGTGRRSPAPPQREEHGREGRDGGQPGGQTRSPG